MVDVIVHSPISPRGLKSAVMRSTRRQNPRGPLSSEPGDFATGLSFRRLCRWGLNTVVSTQDFVPLQ